MQQQKTRQIEMKILTNKRWHVPKTWVNTQPLPM